MDYYKFDEAIDRNPADQSPWKTNPGLKINKDRGLNLEHIEAEYVPIPNPDPHSLTYET